MNEYDGHILQGLVAARRAGRLSRRGFVSRAAQLGIGLPLAATLAKVSGQSALAAPSLALQDGGKTLVVAIPQATVQLDPAVAGSNGYGDIIPWPTTSPRV